MATSRSCSEICSDAASSLFVSAGISTASGIAVSVMVHSFRIIKSGCILDSIFAWYKTGECASKKNEKTEPNCGEGQFDSIGGEVNNSELISMLPAQYPFGTAGDSIFWLLHLEFEC